MSVCSWGFNSPRSHHGGKPRNVEIPTVRGFPYVLEAKNAPENVLIHRVLHSSPPMNDDETAVSTSDMSASRSSLKRFMYQSQGHGRRRMAQHALYGLHVRWFSGLFVYHVAWFVGRRAVGRNALRSPCFGTFDGPPPVEHPIAPERTVIKAAACRTGRGRVSAARRTVQRPRVDSIASTAPAASSGGPHRDTAYGHVRVATETLRSTDHPHAGANRRVCIVTGTAARHHPGYGPKHARMQASDGTPGRRTPAYGSIGL